CMCLYCCYILVLFLIFIFILFDFFFFFFFSSRRRHTRSKRDWSSDVCSSDLDGSPAFNRLHVADWFVFPVSYQLVERTGWCGFACWCLPICVGSLSVLGGHCYWGRTLGL